MLAAGLSVLLAFLDSLAEIFDTLEFSRMAPVKSFIQVAKILLYFFVGIFILSIILGKSPAFFLGGLGALAAVMMLVFKDSILGLVAGIQLSANKMLRIGDWIEMPKYGADGDVIDVSLTTVKVQNWDKTITSIPAFALVSNSFKNWRGMSESGGRRIKRSIFIDMSTIRFCNEEMLRRFRKFHFIAEYIEKKKSELSTINKDGHIDDSELVNGRRMTNIGTFRAYLYYYLRNHEKISNKMTFLIRQLQPTKEGLPIEIYVFSNDIVWANYEAIQADIFDHILACINQFDLKVFQNPTGSDFKSLKKSEG